MIRQRRGYLVPGRGWRFLAPPLPGPGNRYPAAPAGLPAMGSGHRATGLPEDRSQNFRTKNPRFYGQRFT
ncbi:MAG: hypothetical protein CMG82_14145 [Marinobacter sp.]|nr:hypothetical protein [Marinobacter sp.]